MPKHLLKIRAQSICKLYDAQQLHVQPEQTSITETQKSFENPLHLLIKNIFQEYFAFLDPGDICT